EAARQAYNAILADEDATRRDLSQAEMNLTSADRQDAGLWMQDQMRSGVVSFESLSDNQSIADSISNLARIGSDNSYSRGTRVTSLNRIISTYTDMWSNYLIPIKHVYNQSPWRELYQSHLAEASSSVSGETLLQTASALTLIDILE